MADFSIEQSNLADHTGVVVFTVHGELDMSVVNKMEEAVQPIIESGELRAVVFDLADLSYLNSRAIGMMVNFNTILKGSGRTMAFVGVQENVESTLSLVGVTQLIPLYKTIEECAATLDA